MTSVLVTGGAGFIGSHVVDHLVQAKYGVVVIDDLSGGFEDNVNEEAEFYNCSILDYKQMETIFEKHKFEYVFHLAAYAAEGLSHFIKRFNYTNNVVGSVNLINLAVRFGVECFVYTSSAAVYGSQNGILEEDNFMLPEDSYGIAKMAVEKELEISKRMFDLDYIIFRPHNVYGPRQNIGDKYRNVVGIFMNNILQNLPLQIYGDGKQQRAFSYIDDVAPLIAESVLHPSAYGKAINIGTDTMTTLNALAEMVCKTMGCTPNIQYITARDEVEIVHCGHKRLRHLLWWYKDTPLLSGLKMMAAWVMDQGSRESKEFQEIEIEKNLPVNWAESSMKHIIALSGGKDSTAMALRLRELYPDREYEYVLTPTGDELPEMENHWLDLELILGPLKRLTTQTLFDLIEEQKMIPNFRARFCTRMLKIEPFIEYMEQLPAGSIMYVGLRADEEDRLGILQPNRQYEIEYPMKDWCWGINEVLEYLKEQNFIIPKRTDCGACFFQRLLEWKSLLENHPARYESYVQIEKKMGHTFRAPNRDTWPADLDGLRREIQSGRKMRNVGPRNKKCRFCSM